MTKKLAKLLLIHQEDCEEMEEAIRNNLPQYSYLYDVWKESGEQCIQAIEEYGNNEYLYCFYNNDGKYNLYELAEKYLNKLEKLRKS